jgi:glycosyltransferase involved in cell wall biosynthesis
MRVLVDGRYLSIPHETGIATYARNINRLNKDFGHYVDVLCDFPITVRTPAILAEALLYDLHWRGPPGILGRALDLAGALSAVAGVRVRAHEIRRQGFVVGDGLESRLPAHDRILSSSSVFARAAIRFALTGRFLKVDLPDKVDVAHWTMPLPIAIRGAKNIYTLHDIIPLKLPYTTADNRIYFYKMVKRVAETADHIIVVSETTRKDVLELFPAVADKMTNTFQSVQLAPGMLEMPATDLGRFLRQQFGLEIGRYFLFYAAIEPKKNVARLIKAYLAAEIGYPLIIVGKKAYRADEELAPLRFAQARGALGGDAVTNKVIYLDYVQPRELVALVRGARAVLFPSIYEGFGLPVLEAMMCGTPTLTSNLGSLRELATPESAILVDPYDIGSISRAIKRLFIDDDLCSRLSIAGRGRAESFSWARYAERLGEVYRRVAHKEQVSHAGRPQRLPAGEAQGRAP